MSLGELPKERGRLPKAASLVVLLRPGPIRPEVFLLKRHTRNRFFGGAFVFPGGKVDDSDAHPEFKDRMSETSGLERMRARPGTSWSELDRRGATVAAVRELFEEAGVLLARRLGEPAPLRFDASPVGPRFKEHRALLNDGERTFLDVVRDEGLGLATDLLVPFAHWITPSDEPLRFDARTFLAPLPDGQEPSADERETVQALWTTAQGALIAHASREVFLPPPTLRVLEELAEHDSLESVFITAPRRPVHPILPRMTIEDGRTTIYLPWHPRYPELSGEGLEVDEGAWDSRWPAVIEMPPDSGSLTEPTVPEAALELLHFWFGPDLTLVQAEEAIAQRWWRKDPVFDEEIRSRFGALREQAVRGELGTWLESPEGTLAVIILLDQVSRNIFRGSARAYEADRQALALAQQAILCGLDRKVSPMLRSFFYLPLMHAEDVACQQACRMAFERLRKETSGFLSSLQASLQHLEIIQRFGRFPHRNEALGREDTPEEALWRNESKNTGF